MESLTSNSSSTRLIRVDRSLLRSGTLAIVGLNSQIRTNSHRSSSAELIGTSRSCHARRARAVRHAERIEAGRAIKSGHTVPLIGGAGARDRYKSETRQQPPWGESKVNLPLMTVEEPPASVPS